ncbi:MAG: ATPase [Novosphingobium sp.]|nr:ATPase [Novosphingobium sp.]
MVGGSRIIAFGSGSEEPQAEQQSQLVADGYGTAPSSADEPWDEVIPRRSNGVLILAVLALAIVAGWTGFFAWANWPAVGAGITPQQAITLVAAWSPPVLVICVLWLAALRTSTREASRFNDAARQLRGEAEHLEQRLSVVNRELSLAREFLASQNRDLESLGRIAAERITQHAERLDGLIKSNGAQIDAIASVSESALDNMERLRGSLPVIVSSAKDVTNNIANAGRSAQSQLQELISGFHKLNEFGQASERQVQSLRTRVDEAITLFAQQTDTIEEKVSARFAALEHHSGEFRAQLDSHEIEALAAIRGRSGALAEELEATRRQLDEHEGESLTSLRARLSALREETSAIARAMRDGEGSALTNWQAAIARIEGDMQAVVGRIDEVDRQASETAEARLSRLTSDAERFERELTARSQQFEDAVAARQARVLEVEETAAQRLREGLQTLDGEIAGQRAQAEASHASALQAMRTHLAGFDEEIAVRQAAHEAHSERLADHGERIAVRLAEFAERMKQIAAHGERAGSTVAASLQTLTAQLTESRSALSGTDDAVAALTDSSVRLLELIQASARHAKVELPAAIEVGEERLEAVESRTFMLRDVATEAARQGEALSNHVLLTQHTLTKAAQALDALHGGLDDKADTHSAKLAGLQHSLDSLHAGSTALAEQAEGALSHAIAQLAAAAENAVANIEQGSASAVTAVAQRLGEESAAALDKVVRTRAAEAAGQLEQAAAHAAGVSREAAIQLRDQLAKVNELAGNLERRVIHARQRAEEQVDNDFARRSALITEALNSNAIDIAKALDSDVSDTAWAAYLKGDRGIFTRRAVRLLESGEARSVLQLYDGDREFRDHVSHYIHDFEAMLRQMLSTRDGHALGVTLLSSDMGKLYVALAQSIERLRD